MWEPCLQVLHERIIESIRSGLITTDLEGNIYTFNAAATEITGYKSEEMLGKSISAIFGNIEQAGGDHCATVQVAPRRVP